jgi:3-hydroxybutyryl-CoA dehydrogenase
MMQTAIIGSGAMGSGIAQVLAQAGHKVVLYDTQTAALERAEIAIKNAFIKLAEKGKITEEQSTTYLSGLHYSSSLDDLSGSELVIEAIVEDLAIKQQVFRDLEERVNEDCVLATNTSSLSLASIAAACKKPERVIGIHFFNPAPIMALVEIIPAVQTREGLAEQVRDWVQSWGKLPVITKDTPGFIVNRVARPFYSEAIRLLEEGVADCATIDAAMTDIGFKMGPFALMDFIGHDVNYRVTESVWQALYFDPRFKPALSQKRLFEAGFFGRKAGRGFYRYADNMSAPAPQEDPQLRNEIAQRILVMLINEAADAYFLNIASREDLETAMTKGVNYPKGLLAWGAEIGWKNVLQRMEALYQYYQEDRYRVSPQVRLWARE